MPRKDIIKRRPEQPLVLLPINDGEYDDEADIREMSAKIQEFLFSVSKGYSTHHACALSGCQESAVHRWLNPKHKNYKHKLHILFKRAQAIFYAKQMDKVANAPDWKAAIIWLERHEPDWNPKETTLTFNTLPTLKMDAETVAELSAAYDERMKRVGKFDKEEEPAKKEDK
jgi:hypothetical protein